MIRTFLNDLAGLAGRHRRLVILALAIAGAIGVLTAVVFTVQSQRTAACGNCHFMDPFVRHFEASSHAFADCVDCHDYGPGALFINTIKYAAGSYDPRPKSIVPDENCFGSDCHDMAALDPPVEFRARIEFKHSVHLGHEMRGELLRCTSCHNQIVQYDSDEQKHMVVNDRACFVCHFKDAGQGEAITGCNSCHGMPETVVEHAGFTFDHAPYLEAGVECKQCHVSVVRGDGSVPESKCYSCHVERSRRDYTREELHTLHVTENGIDCYRCHGEIEHGNFKMASALEIECQSCHLAQHNQQEQMYVGIGGRSAADLPSDMFLAQVACQGCHTHVTPEGELLARQEKKEASRNSCVTCHGDGWDLMFDNWVAGAAQTIKDYSVYAKAARRDFDVTRGSGKDRQKAQAALRKVEQDFVFAREGRIVHNIWYAVQLLNGAAEEFETAMKGLNPGYAAPSRGSTLAPGNTCVAFCHGSQPFMPETVTYDGSELPHAFHVSEFGLGCEACHSTEEHGKTQIDQSVCADCH